MSAAGFRVLVCGGRDYDNRAVLFADMDTHHKRTPIGLVICGGARGADRLAQDWALERGIPVAVFPASWVAHGKAAGPIRNQSMLDFMRPDLIVAFPGGRGTEDMVRRAVEAGVMVVK